MGNVRRNKKYFNKKPAARTIIINEGTLAGALTQHITPERAMQQTTVFSCVNLISNSVGLLPVVLFKRKGDINERAVEHPLYDVLHRQPNPDKIPVNFYAFLVANLLLRGRAVAYITRYSDGRVYALTPIPPDSFSDYWENGEHVYTIMINGRQQRVNRRDLLICEGMTLDGVHPVSAISYAAGMISGALKVSEYNQKLYQNGGRPSGVLYTPEMLSEPTAAEMGTAFDRNYSGDGIAKTAVLSGGLKYERLSMTNTDAQMLETMAFDRNQICAIFRVPPFMVGGVETSTSWGTGIEEQRNNFVTYTLGHWIKVIEESINRDLLEPDEQKKYYVKFITDGFLRSNTVSRYEAYQKALGGTQAPGFMTPNEVRKLEDLPPITDGSGDVLYGPAIATEPEKELEKETAVQSDEETVF